ncbi:MAG: gamma-glutamyl-gamma-aminobutyrate hydrolase [Gammaproteobacteria bacterium CG22_combo_CG10-13_8_21_14_all_40_8]|nr:MAG: gamma-glutamyl-gamma-aminobutyrate hydrolase [Gammaproteobacteria bacterium CG22_combo_CG10-13_8_21_14_all_40_8]
MSNVDPPLIGVVACNQMLGQHNYNLVGEKYLLAIVNGAGGWPLMLPSLSHQQPIRTLLSCLDGLLLSGSPSNIEPQHYRGEASVKGTLHDPNRDATTLPLICAAIESGLPLLGICRGFQEMNVAFGGTLHQQLYEVEGFIEHRENKKQTLDEQYGFSHEISLVSGGILHDAWKCETAEVNSLHTQGVNQLGDGLRPEAYAPDGLVEAFSVIESTEFALGVQWHPEWKVKQNPFYQSIFKAFGVACQRRAASKMRYHGQINSIFKRKKNN